MFLKSKQWRYIQKQYRLTYRQFYITKLICDGLDNNQLAKKCHISYNTAKTHVRNICRKVSVRGRAELILRLIRVAKRTR